MKINIKVLIMSWLNKQPYIKCTSQFFPFDIKQSEE